MPLDQEEEGHKQAGTGNHLAGEPDYEFRIQICIICGGLLTDNRGACYAITLR